MRVTPSATLGVIAALAMIAAPAAAIEGVYNTGRSEVEVDESGTLDIRFHACADNPALRCGSIVAMRDPSPNALTEMPDGAPIVGFVMIRDLKDAGKGRYRDGKINAVDESLRKGKMMWYGVRIDVAGADEIEVRGCLGFICPRTMKWRRVDHTGASDEATQ